ncbi:hypothetical protein EKO04_009596 [Ascochyta lentis]|uniref:Uncharacterized protein n=1 Tax=Ascochyta lentis TaxID=205686 RepID=A0A8H7IX05_9PLEO|nr:hypothetical protein EKO04_009596 [Ascochyta lentis]
MSGISKKRRTSPCPTRSSAIKQARQASTSTAMHSQRHAFDPQLNRAKSVYCGHSDPYFPHNNGSISSYLPTSDDYFFCIQVISTVIDVSTDVF